MTFNSQLHIGTATSDDVATRDIALWANMCVGSCDALAQLYKTYYPVLNKYGMRVCKDRELVSDSIHELFSRLWTRREHISAATNVKGYLYKSLERILVAQLSRTKRRSIHAPIEEFASDSFEQFWIEGEMRKERLAELKKCLLSLPKCQREVLILKFFNDLTYVEISEIMDLQLASVYNLTSKAIEQLRHRMQVNTIAAS